MVSGIHSWADEAAVRQLAKNDQATLEKKVKQFLKSLFKATTTEEESPEAYKDEIVAKIDDFSGCVEKIGKKKDCRQFIAYTLELFMGHSKIRELFLENREQNRVIRRKLVKLFCLLCTSQLDDCKNQENLVDLILGTYDVTFSIEDQSLLRLLSLLETSGVSLQRYQPFMWGVNGAIFYASKHSQKLAFLKMPSIDEVFKGFEGKRLTNALTAFPIDVQLSNSPVVEIISAEANTVATVTYDPRFLLPMFYHFLSGQSIVKVHKFVTYGPLSFTIAALSSHCPRIRELAYQILFRLHHHLECATYPQDRQLWTGLIDYLRSGLSSETPNQRIESVHTVFFTRLIEILLNPISPLYSSIRQFLLSSQFKPYNYTSLPRYYRICMHLISTTNLQTYTIFQRFAINWITDSLRTPADVRLCHRKRVFSDMLVLYNSPLCASENKPPIMKLLTTLAGLYEGVKVLCFDCAIFAWIKHLLVNVPSIDIAEETNKNLIYKLLITIWDSVEIAGSKVTDNLEAASPKPLSEQKFLFYPAFGFELIDLLSRLLYKSTDQARLDKFVEVCGQILEKTESERSCFNMKQNLLSNLPLNLGSMLTQTTVATMVDS